MITQKQVASFLANKKPFGGRRLHLDEFMECLLYNTEYKQEARRK